MMKSRKIIRLTSFLCAFGIVMSVFFLSERQKRQEFEVLLGQSRASSLLSLCEYLEKTGESLELLAFSSDEAARENAEKVCSYAVGVCGCLSCFAESGAFKASESVARIYDAAREILNHGMSDDKRTLCLEIAAGVKQLYSELNSAAYKIMNEGTLTANELLFDGALPNGMNGNAASSAQGVCTAAFFEGKKTVSEKEAKEAAGEICDINPVLWRSDGKKTENGVSVYVFRHGDVEIKLCEAGGSVYEYRSELSLTEKKLTAEQALEKVEILLKKCGFNDVELLYAEENELSAEFIFARSFGGALITDENVCVEVRLSDGEIRELKASGYIVNYGKKPIVPDVPTPDFSSIVPSLLQYERSTLCLSDINDTDRLCYMIFCSYENKRVVLCADFYSLNILKAFIISGIGI